MTVFLFILAVTLITWGLWLGLCDAMRRPWLLLGVAAFCLLRAWSLKKLDSEEEEEHKDDGWPDTSTISGMRGSGPSPSQPKRDTCLRLVT